MAFIREMLTNEQIIDSATSSTALRDDKEDYLRKTDFNVDTNAVLTVSKMTKKVSETLLYENVENYIKIPIFAAEMCKQKLQAL